MIKWFLNKKTDSSVIEVKHRKDSSMRKQIVTFRSLPAIGWMGVIYTLSAQDGRTSGSLSGGLSEILLSFIQYLGIPLKEDTFHFLLRKGAHFTAYLILGLLFAYWLQAKSLKDYLLCLVFSFLYAASDEFHQRYVPGRSGEFRDILIDSFGALTGLSGFYLIRRILSFRKPSIKHAKDGSLKVT